MLRLRNGHTVVFAKQNLEHVGQGCTSLLTFLIQHYDLIHLRQQLLPILGEQAEVYHIY